MSTNNNSSSCKFQDTKWYQNFKFHLHVLNQSCCVYSLQSAAKKLAIADLVIAFLVILSELIFTALPDIYNSLYNLWNMTGQVILTPGEHKFFNIYIAWLFITVLIICLFLLILEGWLCDTLYKGATERSKMHLNRWFNTRVLLFLISTMMTIYNIVEYTFSLYDVLYLPLKMYRILEIILVKGLVSEIVHGTVGVV